MTWEKPLNDYCIYALKCPDTQEIRYIGQTTNGITPFYAHYRDFKLNKEGRLIKVKAWIKKLKSNGKKFLVEYLDYASTREELNQKEIYWIKYYRDLGLNLLNHADGGYIATIKKYTDEEKLEISRRTKEAMARPEVRSKFLEAYKKRNHPKKYTPWSEEAKLSVKNSEYYKKQNFIIEDEFGNKYVGLKDIGKFLNISKSVVAKKMKLSTDNVLIYKDKKYNIIQTPAKFHKKPLSCNKPIIDNKGVVYLTQEEAALYLNMHKRTVLRLLKNKKPSKTGITLSYYQEGV